jgi:hypothetical protein
LASKRCLSSNKAVLQESCCQNIEYSYMHGHAACSIISLASTSRRCKSIACVYGRCTVASLSSSDRAPTHMAACRHGRRSRWWWSVHGIGNLTAWTRRSLVHGWVMTHDDDAHWPSHVSRRIISDFWKRHPSALFSHTNNSIIISC